MGMGSRIFYGIISSAAMCMSGTWMEPSSSTISTSGRCRRSNGRLRRSVITTGMGKLIFSGGINGRVRFMFGIGVDTQTGIKAFNYKPEWKTDSWAFDIEILYNAKKMGKEMIEVPIKAIVSDTKTFGDIWKTLIDSLKIRFQ